jgi:hypothetical protein
MEELLKYLCMALEERQISYMLTGSVAMGAYTVARYTRDIDIVIELNQIQLNQLAIIFKENFYFHQPSAAVEVDRRGMFNVIDNTSGFKVDFILRKETLLQRSMFARRQRGEIWKTDCWLISVEDLILSKLIWIQQLTSENQLADIQNLVNDNPEIDYDYVNHWIKILSLDTFTLLIP